MRLRFFSAGGQASTRGQRSGRQHARAPAAQQRTHASVQQASAAASAAAAYTGTTSAAGRGPGNPAAATLSEGINEEIREAHPTQRRRSGRPARRPPPPRPPGTHSSSRPRCSGCRPTACCPAPGPAGGDRPGAACAAPGEDHARCRRCSTPMRQPITCRAAGWGHRAAPEQAGGAHLGLQRLAHGERAVEQHGAGGGLQRSGGCSSRCSRRVGGGGWRSPARQLLSTAAQPASTPGPRHHRSTKGRGS